MISAFLSLSPKTQSHAFVQQLESSIVMLDGDVLESQIDPTGGAKAKKYICQISKRRSDPSNPIAALTLPAEQ
jgi:hypothetical protein